MFSNLNVFGMMPIILPASDIVDGAKSERGRVTIAAKMPEYDALDFSG